MRSLVLILMLADLAWLTQAQIIEIIHAGLTAKAALGGFGLGAAKGYLLSQLLKRKGGDPPPAAAGGGQGTTLEIISDGYGYGGGGGPYRSRREINHAAKAEETWKNFEMIAAMKPEECYERILCSAATGKLRNKVLVEMLDIVNGAMALRPGSTYTRTYRQAESLGSSRQDIEKCEYRYQCSLSMDVLNQIFQ